MSDKGYFGINLGFHRPIPGDITSSCFRRVLLEWVMLKGLHLVCTPGRRYILGKPSLPFVLDDGFQLVPSVRTRSHRCAGSPPK